MTIVSEPMPRQHQAQCLCDSHERQLNILFSYLIIIRNHLKEGQVDFSHACIIRFKMEKLTDILKQKYLKTNYSLDTKTKKSKQNKGSVGASVEITGNSGHFHWIMGFMSKGTH